MVNLLQEFKDNSRFSKQLGFWRMLEIFNYRIKSSSISESIRIGRDKVIFRELEIIFDDIIKNYESLCNDSMTRIPYTSINDFK